MFMPMCLLLSFTYDNLLLKKPTYSYVNFCPVAVRMEDKDTLTKNIVSAYLKGWL